MILLKYTIIIWGKPEQTPQCTHVHVQYVHVQCMCMCRGSPHTSQNSHLLLHPSLWLLVPGLSSHFLHYILCTLYIQPAQHLIEMATRFCKLQEPLYVRTCTCTCTLYVQYIRTYIHVCKVHTCTGARYNYADNSSLFIVVHVYM